MYKDQLLIKEIKKIKGFIIKFYLVKKKKNK